MLNVSSYEDVICAQGEVPLLDRNFPVFLFLVDGLLVDTGPRCMSEDLIPFFQSHEIAQVVLTHLHEDHSGMAAWLQENRQVPIYLHRDALDAASQQAALPLYRLKLWGERPPFHARNMPAEIRTPHHRFQTIDTPGHCDAHIVLYEEERGWLFTGDVFVTIKQQVAFREENLSLMIESLQALLKLDFETIFCAHTGVQKQGYRLLREKLAFLLELRARVDELAAQGLNPRMIARKLFPSPHPVTDVSEGEGTAYHLVRTLSRELMERG